MTLGHGFLRVNILLQDTCHDRHAAIAPHSVETLLNFQQHRASPSPSHVRASPTLHITAQMSCARKATLDDVRTSKTFTQQFAKTQPTHSQQPRVRPKEIKLAKLKISCTDRMRSLARLQKLHEAFSAFAPIVNTSKAMNKA